MRWTVAVRYRLPMDGMETPTRIFKTQVEAQTEDRARVGAQSLFEAGVRGVVGKEDAVVVGFGAVEPSEGSTQ